LSNLVSLILVKAKGQSGFAQEQITAKAYIRFLIKINTNIQYRSYCESEPSQAEPLPPIFHLLYFIIAIITNLADVTNQFLTYRSLVRGDGLLSWRLGTVFIDACTLWKISSCNKVPIPNVYSTILYYLFYLKHKILFFY
jgi:hypothetical protein